MYLSVGGEVERTPAVSWDCRGLTSTAIPAEPDLGTATTVAGEGSTDVVGVTAKVWGSAGADPSGLGAGGIACNNMGAGGTTAARGGWREVGGGALATGPRWGIAWFSKRTSSGVAG